MSLHMNPDVRAAWCAALRSGGYQQGQQWLRRDGKFCCLGVLTDLAVKAGVFAWPSTDDLSFLPASVAKWAGIDEGEEEPVGNPVIADAETSSDDELDPGVYATEANDVLGWDFAAIADAIDGGKP